MQPTERSQAKIEHRHLEQLLRLAVEDREDLFRRKPDIGRLYADGILCTALCQGAALHFVDGKNGVKDFDVWTFYRAHSDRPFPYRRRGVADFGLPDFGRHPNRPDFTGRSVDLIGRSIRHASNRTPIESVEAYLRGGATKSASLLAKRPIVLLEPNIGRVLGPFAG